MSYTDIFMRCVNIILRNEGGYTCNPLDPGGETNMGIAGKFYPDLDIKNLTRNQAIEIYFRDYWSKMNLRDIYDENLILQIFDMGVNSGIRTAIKTIQRIVNVAEDGFIGPVTIEAINNREDDLVNPYKQERRKYYSSIVRKKPELDIFLKGWFKRIENYYF